MDPYAFPEDVRCRALGKPVCSCLQRTKKTCDEHERKRKKKAGAEEEEKDVVILQRSLTTTCTVNLQGATITSWRIENEEQLFVARRSYYHPHFPIRGGVALAFPFFGQWSFGPRHGVVRKIRWRLLVPPQKMASGDVQAAFIVCDDAYTRSIWGNNFWLCFWVILQAAELHLRYFVFNTNHLMPFECTPMLMTTFRVPDVMHCHLTGLHECECSEDETDIDFDVEQRQAVRVDDYVRRLYYNTPDLNLSDERTGRTVSLIKDMPDTQIWNPWDGREPMLCFYTQVVEEVDFDPDDYLNMLRISCGHVRKPITLNPNEYFVSHMVIKVDKPRQEHLKKEGKARTSRVLPDLPRDVAFSLPRLPRFSTLLVPGLRDATARSQYASPSLTDIPYMVAEEIFTHVTKKDVPYMMAEDAVARVTDDDVPYKLAEEIVSQVTNK